MSPRAAWRLERLGFGEVYDYAAGKADWAAAGLPVEGDEAATPRIGPRAHADVPTCGPDEAVGAVRARLGDWRFCVVVGDNRVVLGLAVEDGLGADDDRRVEEVMREGPSTFRADVPVDE